MAMMVRSEHDLPTIRVALAADRTEVEFSAARGRELSTVVASCSTADLGPLDRIPLGESPPDTEFRLPAAVLDRLRGVADELGQSPTPPQDALWLELPNPRGYLYLVPWEQLLAPLDRPIIRLPNHTVRPQAPSQALEVALCASSPPARPTFDAATELDRLARLWHRYPGHTVHSHLFTDAASVGELRTRVTDLAPHVTVHDPPGPEDYERWALSYRSSSTTVVTNPWLRWMCESMRGKALDVAQFVGHGYLAVDRGAIALASPPTDAAENMSSRFVGAAELSAFLSQLGAWSLVLSAPSGDESGVGLRELADAIAVTHPGVTLVHESRLDRDGTQFAELLAMVYGGGTAIDVAMPGVTCWVHPQFVEFPPEERDALMLTPDGRSSLIKDATHQVLAGDDTPTWLASGTRYLEALQTQWLPNTIEERVDPDAVAALRSVSNLLEKHARRHLESGDRR